MSDSSTVRFSTHWWMHTSIQLILFLAGFLVVYPLGFRGFMGLDQSIVFEAGGRIYHGQKLYTDFYLPYGVIPAYLQAFLFWILGVSWKSYVIHACLINGCTSVLVYQLVKKLTTFPIWINAFIALYTAAFFYTITGTPYPENHAQFFCLLGGFLLINAQQGKAKSLWWFPLVMALAFFSKQTPTVYYMGFYVFWALLNWRSFRSAIRDLLIGFIPLTLLLAYFLLTFDHSMFWFYFFQFPKELGAERMAKLNLPWVWEVYNLVHDSSKNFLLVLPLSIFLSFKTNESKYRLSWVFGCLLCLIGLIGAASTNNQLENLYPFMTLGTFLTIHPLYQWVKNKRKVLATLLALILIPLSLQLIVNRYAFIMERKFHDISYDYTNESIWKSETTGIYLQQQVAFGHVSDYDNLIRFLMEADENFIWFGDASCFSTLIGNVSPMPLVFYHPGLSYPDPDKYPEAFAKLKEQTLLAMKEKDTRYLVIEHDATYMGATVSQFWDGIIVDTAEVAKFGHARVLEISF